MSENILIDKIDNYINKIGHDEFQVSKDKALKIIKLIQLEDKTYYLMLHFLKENIEMYYDHPNESVKRQFKIVLEFYDLIPNDLTLENKRTTIEKIGSESIKSKYILECRTHILEIL
jgi:hypothetical protein